MATSTSDQRRRGKLLVRLKPFFEIIRPLNCLAASLGVFVGLIIAVGFNFPLMNLILGMLSCFLICAAGNVINDYYDVEIDRINAPHRPIPSGRVSSQEAYIYAVLLFTVGGLLSLAINIYAAVLAVFEILLLYLYASKFKLSGIFGNMLVSFSVGATIIYGSLISGDLSSLSRSMVFASAAILANMAREIMKDIEDVNGDRERRSRSLPIIYGMRFAAGMSVIFLLIAVFISPLPVVLNFIKSFPYLPLVLISDIIFIYICVSIYLHIDEIDVLASRFQRMMKAGMLIALLAFVLSGIW